MAGYLMPGIEKCFSHLFFGHPSVNPAFRVDGALGGIQSAVQVECALQPVTVEYLNQAHVLFHTVIVA